MLVQYAIGTELLDCNPVAPPADVLELRRAFFPHRLFAGKERVTAVYVGD